MRGLNVDRCNMFAFIPLISMKSWFDFELFLLRTETAVLLILQCEPEDRKSNVRINLKNILKKSEEPQRVDQWYCLDHCLVVLVRISIAYLCSFSLNYEYLTELD